MIIAGVAANVVESSIGFILGQNSPLNEAEKSFEALLLVNCSATVLVNQWPHVVKRELAFRLFWAIRRRHREWL